MKNKLLLFFISLSLVLGACLRTNRQILHPVSGKEIKVIEFMAVENLTSYDNEPFVLARKIRERIHQRYKVRVSDENPDVRVKFIFRFLRRGTLREGNLDTKQSLFIEAELKLYDLKGKEIDHSRQSRHQSYINNSSSDYTEALNTLILRLSDQLVVDLLEP